MDCLLRHAPDRNRFASVHDDGGKATTVNPEAEGLHAMRLGSRRSFCCAVVFDHKNDGQLLSRCKLEGVTPGIKFRALLRTECDYNPLLLFQLVSQSDARSSVEWVLGKYWHAPGCARGGAAIAGEQYVQRCARGDQRGQIARRGGNGVLRAELERCADGYGLMPDRDLVARSGQRARCLDALLHTPASQQRGINAAQRISTRRQ